MKRALFVILYFCTLLSAAAIDDKQAKINSIKKDTCYIYADITKATQEEASAEANRQLKQNALEWLASEDLTAYINAIEENIHSQADTILTRRLEMYRLFLYIKKSNLLQLSSKNHDTNESIESMKHTKYFFELQQKMEAMKQRGDIKDYGKYATMKHPEQCYLIVYDAAGNIRAWLGKGINTRMNLQTGEYESLMNYRGCGAIWFIMNE